jgi:osmoprotectant transport system permease protein
LSNTYAGIKQVSFNMTNVARAMGMTPFQVLFYVEIPLSLPVLINGIRIAIVSTIGMVTLTSLVGSGGLGELIVQGLRTMQLDLVLMGTIPAAILAILFDVILSRIGAWLLPEHESFQ